MEKCRTVQGMSTDNVTEMEIDVMTKRLKKYRALNREIDNEIERLESLESKMTSVSSVRITGMPRASSTTHDRMAEDIIRKADLEASLSSLIKVRNEEYDKLETLVRQIENADERAVIRMRYFDSEEWSMIIYMLYGREREYESKIENYKQRVYRHHKSAISKLCMLKKQQN